MRVQTQWSYAGDPPAHTGLDYGRVIAVMKTVGIRKRDRADVLSRLQIFELEALKVLGRQRARALAKIRHAAPRGGTPPRRAAR